MFINPTSLAKDNALAQFTTDLLFFSSDIGLVAETWFKKSRQMEATLDINGYTLFMKDREGRRGGGVCAYIKTSLFPSFHESPYWNLENQFEFFWFWCKAISSDSKFFYCTVYHPSKPVYKSDNLINALLTDIEMI